MIGTRRVAVTGLGAITSGGRDVDGLWEALVNGRSLATDLPDIDESYGPIHIGCRVAEDFEASVHLTHSELRRTDLTTQLGICAAMDAVADAGWEPPGGDRTAIVVGTGLGGMIRPFVGAVETLEAKGFMRVNPLTVPLIMPNATAGWLSMKLGVTGTASTVSQACASGAAAIGDAARLVAAGIVDRAVAGGTDALTHPLVVAAFARMGALSARNDEPGRARRPFDRDRDGFVMGDGAGFVTLEAEEHVVARGGHIRARVTGYGTTSDAFHLVAPHETAAGAIAAMRAALADAGLAPRRCGPRQCPRHLHRAERPPRGARPARRLRRPGPAGHRQQRGDRSPGGSRRGGRGRRRRPQPRDRIGSPTANFENPDPDIDLDLVAGSAREVAAGPVLSNSFAFGGHNVTLILEP